MNQEFVIQSVENTNLTEDWYEEVKIKGKKQNYTQIEKEALAIKFGCDKFHQLIYGKTVDVETDHRPLETIFKKPLSKAPPRLQRIFLQIQQYDLRIKYKKGKELLTADLLSRDCSYEDTYLEENFEVLMTTPTNKSSYEELQALTKEDQGLQELKNLILYGWPNYKSAVPESFKKYWPYRDELSTNEDLIFKGSRVFIPLRWKAKILKLIHEGHQGTNSCLRRARDSIYWHGMSQDIINTVENCRTCQANQRNKTKEPMIIKEIPSLPWEIVAADIFSIKGKNYLLITDNYSGFIDFKEMKTMNSAETIESLKKWFSVHGIPRLLETDNGPNFTSRDFKDSQKKGLFDHQTSSPLYPKSNGLADRAVQTAKNLIRKCLDSGQEVELALLNFYNTPRDGLPSPAQCLFSRRTRTLLPTSTHQLEPEIQKGHTQNLRNKREKQKTHHDKTAKTTRSFKEGEKIMLKQHHREWIPARVTQEVAPRSYKVQTPTGEYRRNSSFMRHTNLESPKQQRRRIPEIPKSTLPEGPGPSGDKEQAQVSEELNTSPRPFTGQEPRSDHQNAEHKNGTLPITTRSGVLKKLIQTVLGVSTLGAGVIAYANYDEDFRKKLEHSVPAAKPLLDYVNVNLKGLSYGTQQQPAVSKSSIPPSYLETRSKGKPVKVSLCVVSICIVFFWNVTPTQSECPTLANNMSGRSGVLKKLIQTVLGVSTLGAGVIAYANYDEDFRKKLEHSVPAAKPLLDYVNVNLKGLSYGTQQQPAVSKSSVPPSYLETRSKGKPVKEVDKLLPQVEKQSQETASAYAEAEAASQDYVSTLLRALNVSNPEEEEQAWAKVFSQMEVRESKLQQVVAKEKALSSMLEFRVILDQERGTWLAVQLSSVSKNDAITHYYEELAARSSVDLKKELEAILPEAKNPNATLTPEHMKTVLAHALHKIELVQKKLAIQKALKDERKKYEEILEAKEQAIKSSIEKESESEFEKRASMLREDFEQELVVQLRRQTAAHVNHLQEMLEVQQRDLKRKYQELLDERVIDQKQLFNEEMGLALAKILKIEESIKIREDLDNAVKSTQRLWLAAQSLRTNLQVGQRTNQFPDSRVTLGLELGAIQETAGIKDPSILVILASIPQTAIENGVVPQDHIKARYNKVEKVCRNVALIESNTNAPLIQYLISYLRGLLAVPVTHTDTQGLVDPSSWTTIEVLGHIRQCIASEDLEQALRYANLLRGKPREVALGWMGDLKVLLETQQAVDALIAHVTSISVQAFL
ncbi:K02A2.6-like [Cordylochernes scorpioides]|uniref:MICOS complex subunit MIC60 n=1 Tax=Cordylochernes scorpioides TaxID=51811 RepID=A0ABY6KHX0_9ARAC|nr:K02A2.6-like [Cordylochernes scorpioides]